MDYPIQEGFIYLPKEPTEDQSKAADLIYNITGISRERLISCICHYGIDRILSNPEVLGISIQDQQKITDLKELLFIFKEI